MPKIQDKPLFAGALGRNRKRVNDIWSTKNFFDEVETKKLISSYGNKRTVTTCGSIVDFVKGCGKLEERNFVTLANNIQNELRSWQSTPEIHTLEKPTPN